MAATNPLVPTPYIWLDGALVPWDQAQVHFLTHSLHYGVAAFEGIRLYRCEDGSSAIFRLGEHVDRLLASCKITLIESPYTREQLIDASLEIVRANALPEAYLRPMIFLGAGGGLGLGSSDSPVRVAIASYAWGAYLGADGLKKGIRACVASFTRGGLNSMMSKGKITGQYVGSVLAKRQALKDGFDEAIMLDVNGHVAEATGENLFMVKRGVLHTPPLSSPILEGITRDTILVLARELGITIVERTFARDELYCSDEVFLCGTAAELTPVREIDNRPVGAGVVGPVTARLQAAFLSAVRGGAPYHPEWLTKI